MATSERHSERAEQQYQRAVAALLVAAERQDSQGTYGFVARLLRETLDDPLLAPQVPRLRDALLEGKTALSATEVPLTDHHREIFAESLRLAMVFRPLAKDQWAAVFAMPFVLPGPLSTRQLTQFDAHVLDRLLDDSALAALGTWRTYPHLVDGAACRARAGNIVTMHELFSDVVKMRALDPAGSAVDAAEPARYTVFFRLTCSPRQGLSLLAPDGLPEIFTSATQRLATAVAFQLTTHADINTDGFAFEPMSDALEALEHSDMITFEATLRQSLQALCSRGGPCRNAKLRINHDGTDFVLEIQMPRKDYVFRLDTGGVNAMYQEAITRAAKAAGIAPLEVIDETRESARENTRH